MKALVLAFSLLLALALPSRAGTYAVTVSVTCKYSDGQIGEQAYALKNVKVPEILLPTTVPSTSSRLLSADWQGSDDQGGKELTVSLQDPAIILPGTPSPSNPSYATALEIFHVTLPYSPGQKQLLYSSPTESVSIQIDEEKK